MANEKNLRPPYSPNEARSFGAKGGKKSGESKRRKKTIAETIDKLLNEKIKDQRQLAIIEKSGMPINGTPTYKDFLVASVIMKSIKRGSVDDLEKLACMIGEKAPETNTEDSVQIVIDV